MDEVFDCEERLTTYVDPAELQRFESKYNENLQHGRMAPAVEYGYGRCLILSRFPADIIKGTVLMEQLLQLKYRVTDCCYLTALANIKLRNYTKAREFANLLLSSDPSSLRGRHLRDSINARVLREYLFQAAVVGGVTVVISVLVSVVLSRR